MGTLCGHYFCENCAIKKSRETKRCAVCGQNTKGIFNEARKLIKKLKKREEEEAKEAEKEAEEEAAAGEEAKSDDKTEAETAA